MLCEIFIYLSNYITELRDLSLTEFTQKEKKYDLQDQINQRKHTENDKQWNLFQNKEKAMKQWLRIA